MKSAVFAIVSSPLRAESVVDELILAGFPTHDISVLYPNVEGTRGFRHVKSNKAPEGALIGGGAGGALGGLAGLMMGLGTLTVPGVGLFVATGPILVALSGAAIGATAGGITGALIGLGFPEYEARLYADKLENGSILVAAHTENSQAIKAARVIFERADAHEIGVTHEALLPS